jgi:hypothetical protein
MKLTKTAAQTWHGRVSPEYTIFAPSRSVNTAPNAWRQCSTNTLAKFFNPMLAKRRALYTQKTS